MRTKPHDITVFVERQRSISRQAAAIWHLSHDRPSQRSLHGDSRTNAAGSLNWKNSLVCHSYASWMWATTTCRTLTVWLPIPIYEFSGYLTTASGGSRDCTSWSTWKR